MKWLVFQRNGKMAGKPVSVKCPLEWVEAVLPVFAQNNLISKIRPKYQTSIPPIRKRPYSERIKFKIGIK